MAATKIKRTPTAPKRPEKKYGPFHGGVGLAVWLNQVQGDEGPRFFRSNVVKLVMWRQPSNFVMCGAKACAFPLVVMASFVALMARSQ